MRTSQQPRHAVGFLLSVLVVLALSPAVAFARAHPEPDLPAYAQLTLQVGLGLDPACRTGDLDGDLDVDLADAAIFQAVFTDPRGGGTPAPANPYLFTGRRIDFDLRDTDGSVTGQAGRPLLVLYDYRARAYDPFHGRLCQRDPAFYAESLNLYQYALSNPQGRMDPAGLFSFGDILSTMSIGARIYGMADTAMTLRQAVAAFVAGASLQSVILSLAIDMAADKVGGKLLDPVTDLAGPLLNKIGRKLSKGLKGAAELKWEMHHAFPKFLVGKGNGLQLPLPKGLHTDYHAGLLRALKEKGIYPKPGQKWDDYLQEQADLGMPNWDEALNILMNYTRDFDKAQGTNVLNALWQAFVDQGVLK